MKCSRARCRSWLTFRMWTAAVLACRESASWAPGSPAGGVAIGAVLVAARAAFVAAALLVAVWAAAGRAIWLVRRSSGAAGRSLKLRPLRGPARLWNL